MECIERPPHTAGMLPKTLKLISTTGQVSQGDNQWLSILCIHSQTPTSQSMMMEFPTVLDGRIKNMEGELFHISLADDATPFVSTPLEPSPSRIVTNSKQSLTCYKGSRSLSLLQRQQIIEPVTTPTVWFTPIIVAPKKDPGAIPMCVDLSRLN